ncbi:MAG: hypothetical protein AAF558_10780 [Verrucomicrobiota bacterium]
MKSEKTYRPLFYESYRNLPTVAGICSLQDGANPGIGVQDCVDRLKRYHYTLQRLWNLFNARIPSEPIYELKMGFSLHTHLCAEHVTTIEERVGEMRHPPLGLDKVPHKKLELFFDEVQAAPTLALLHSVYAVALPALKVSMERHIRETNHLADHPTVRILRFALLEIDQMIDYGQRAIGCLRNEKKVEGLEDWLALLENCLLGCGGLDGTEPEQSPDCSAVYSIEPFEFDGLPQRDERFEDPYNMGVHAEEFLHDERYPADIKTMMMYYRRLREIDVPEMMAGVLYQTKNKSWKFYRDMTRQLWDEARHALMGEVGFVHHGIDWPKYVMINFTWSKELFEQLEPKQRHAVLWYIEQGQMGKEGKRYEWEVGKDAEDPLAMLFQDYDWADEVLHARIGRDWYVRGFKDSRKAAEYGNECWNTVTSGWQNWKDQGLTEHRNWWPELYKEVCRLRGIEPNPEVLAYKTNYAKTRADLKQHSFSG